jgi:hypothetical protein
MANLLANKFEWSVGVANKTGFDAVSFVIASGSN